MVVISDMLLLSASDGVMVLQQRHSLLQRVCVGTGGAGLGGSEDLKLSCSLQVGGGLSDPPFGGSSAGEIACSVSEALQVVQTEEQ